MSKNPAMKFALIFGFVSILGSVAALFAPPGPAYIATGTLAFAGILAAAIALLYRFRVRAHA
jgi:hypothetical protein